MKNIIIVVLILGSFSLGWLLHRPNMATSGLDFNKALNSGGLQIEK